MRALIAGGDAKALRCAAHTLQSSAATFGFCRLAGLAGVIETQAANAGAQGLGVLVDAAADALGSGRAEWMRSERIAAA